MPRIRRWVVALARLLVSAALMTTLFLLLPRAAILTAIRQATPRLVAAVLLGFVVGHILAALKWRLLLEACGLKTPASRAIRAHGAGLFANLFLPSLVGGDTLRTVLAARPSGRIEVALVGTMADRVLDTVALLLLVAVAAAFLPGALTETTTHLLLVVVGVLLLAVALGLVALLLRPGWFPSRWRKRARSAREAVLALADRPVYTCIAVALAIIIQSAFIVLNVGLGRAVGLAMPLTAWFFLWPLAKLAALAPISFGGIGVREAAFATLVTPFAVDPTLAVAQSLLWEAILIGGGLSGGLWWFLTAKQRTWRVREDRHE